MTMNKPRLAILAALCVLALSAAHAADTITGIKGKQVELFDVPDDAKPGRKIDVAGLPWTVKEEKNSFLKVAVGGKDVWVDSMQVNLVRDAKSGCPPKTAMQKSTVPVTNAAQPGAAMSQCP